MRNLNVFRIILSLRKEQPHLLEQKRYGFSLNSIAAKGIRSPNKLVLWQMLTSYTPLRNTTKQNLAALESQAQLQTFA